MLLSTSLPFNKENSPTLYPKSSSANRTEITTSGNCILNATKIGSGVDHAVLKNTESSETIISLAFHFVPQFCVCQLYQLSAPNLLWYSSDNSFVKPLEIPQLFSLSVNSPLASLSSCSSYSFWEIIFVGACVFSNSFGMEAILLKSNSLSSLLTSSNNAATCSFFPVNFTSLLTQFGIMKSFNVYIIIEN